mgnify:CR=1 FL=1
MELRMDIQPAFHYAGDGRLIEKVFTNVIGNAVAYSPVGATVTVSLQNGIFFVENSGIHIDEEDLKQIFTPFYRVDKSRNRNSGGSGLGLALCQRIAVAHDGTLKIESEPGKGTRVSVTLPLWKKEADA